ncbi:MAG: UDP-N-acetylglucosamine 1-carboxyvinyltransferase, partial [Candidatus Komeilibacteria bacterium]|nr:UDP-N-acetylglucosamine 1-carboxyvinyltransferase [Candidatus Komeilibacteria bacterium]
MSKFIITGQKPLQGEIAVKGAKNFALKILCASLLSAEPMVIKNVPLIEDIERLAEIIEKTGVKIKRDGRVFTVDSSNLNITHLDPVLVPKLRSATLLIGPMVARLGEVRLPHPGGCFIGRRPIDLFIDGFRALGIDFKEEEDHYYFSAKRIIGGTFVFPLPSVTVTEALIMTAVLASGQTKLINAACEPEIQALAEYLNKQGAKIKGAGTSVIIIDGVDKISAGEVTVMPDRIEAGSFVALALATNSEITMAGCNPDHLAVPLAIWRKMGAQLEIGDSYIKVKQHSKPLTAHNITTREYPGFPT